MSHTIVTYHVKPGSEEENAALVRAVFEELAERRPNGFRYAVFQSTDSRQFVHLYTDEGAGSGALQQLAAFQSFVAGAPDRHEQAATVDQFEVVGVYNTLDKPDHPPTAGGSVPATATRTGETADTRIEAGGRP